MYNFLRFIGHIEWISYGIRYRIIKFFVPFNTNFPFTSNFFNLVYEGNLNSYIDWQIYFFGAYEKRQLRLIEREINLHNRKKIVLDIGANSGNHSLFFSNIFKTVHSFEPFPLMYAKLHNNITKNKLNNVVAHSVGLSNQNSALPFIPPQTNNQGTGTLEKNRILGEYESISIDVYQGDFYCKLNNIENIDLLKIDVEGHEFQVFEGLEETIKKYTPLIWFEFSATISYEQKQKLFNQILSNYRFYSLEKKLRYIEKNKIFNLNNEINIFAIPA